MDKFESAKVLFYEGLACFEREDYALAEAKLQECLNLVPDRVSTLVNLSATLIKLKKMEAARTHSRKALALEENSPECWLNLGLIAQEEHDPPEAIRCFDKAIQFEPGLAAAWSNKGVALGGLKRHDEALVCHDQAIRLAPQDARAWSNRGVTLRELMRAEEALASQDQALTLKPAYADAHNNRGLILLNLGRPEEALASFARTIESRPANAGAHCNRGLALLAIERRDEALAAFEQAAAIDPAYVDAGDNVLWLHLSELGNLALIEKLGRESLARNIERELKTFRAGKTMPDFRVLHNLEQTSLLLALGYQSDGLQEANASLQEIQARCEERRMGARSPGLMSLSDSEVADISRFRQQARQYQVPDDMGDCLASENDWQAIEDEYLGGTPEIVCIDNLLSARALQELRRFCQLSAVWKIEYGNQYLGAFPKSGFLSPLHVGIARELGQKMPRIFGPHRLEQLWGFKYSSKLGAGIKVHADFSRVNLNFWITPDEANLDPESGGLVVYDVASPPSWPFQEYNGNENAIYEFLRKSGAGKRRIPYRCNRAVLFNSNLFHETDEIHFKEGYENRRINVTYLFGKGLKTP